MSRLKPQPRPVSWRQPVLCRPAATPFTGQAGVGVDVAIERCDIDDKRRRWQVSNVVRGTSAPPVRANSSA
jgi:hypothetical protein